MKVEKPNSSECGSLLDFRSSFTRFRIKHCGKKKVRTETRFNCGK